VKKDPKRLRVIWLCNYLISEKSKGGRHANSWIQTLSREIISNKNNIDLIIFTNSTKTKKDYYFEEGGIKCFVFKNNFLFLKRGYPYFFPINQITFYNNLTSRMAALIIKLKPDIIHAHGTEGPYALPLLKLHDIPSITSIQGIITEILSVEKKISYLIQRQIEKKLVKNLKCFGCRTDWDRNFINSSNPEAIIHNMPEAINNVYYGKSWEGHNHNTILFIGSIVQRKGLEVLIDAIALLKQKGHLFELNIIGNGKNQYIKKLKKKADKLNIDDRINWVGFLNPDDILKYLLETAVYVLPTFMDNSPNTLFEAMTVGVPSIASAVGGIPSIARDSKAVILTKPGDSKMLAEKIMQVCTNIPLKIKLSQNGKDFTQPNKPFRVSEVTIGIYKKIIDDFKARSTKQ